MKIKQNIVARDSQGNEYSTMEEIFGFRTSYRLYIICAESSALIAYEYTLISEGFHELRNRESKIRHTECATVIITISNAFVLLAGDEMITNVYTEDQISIEVKVKDDE